MRLPVFFNLKKLNNKSINLINVNFNHKKTFDKISSKSNYYISQCFDLGLKLMKENKGCALINGPISKKYFLREKFPGITEYISEKFLLNNGFKREKFNLFDYDKDSFPQEKFDLIISLYSLDYHYEFLCLLNLEFLKCFYLNFLMQENYLK